MENRRDLQASYEAQEPQSATVPQTSFRVAWEKVCEIVECESRYSLRIQRQFRLEYLRSATNEKEIGTSLFSLLSRGCENLQNAN